MTTLEEIDRVRQRLADEPEYQLGRLRIITEERAMTALPQLTPDDLADAPRPVRRGTDLDPDDQTHALTHMAPAELADPRAWLATHAFVVRPSRGRKGSRPGRLDRRHSRPIATLEDTPPCT